MHEGSSGWMKQVEEYMHAVGVSHAELTEMKKEKINLKINEWEERRWRTEVKKEKPWRYIGQRRELEKVYLQMMAAL